MSVAGSKRVRGSADDWRAIFERQRTSGLSQAAFCEEKFANYHVGYSTLHFVVKQRHRRKSWRRENFLALCFLC